MTPLTVRALFLLALAGPVRAGQIEAPVSGEFRPGTRSGAAGLPLGALPAPIVQPALAQSAAASVAVKKGYESYMVMEKLDAEPSHFKNVFNLEQRVAVALFTRTFGVGDLDWTLQNDADFVNQFAERSAVPR